MGAYNAQGQLKRIVEANAQKAKEKEKADTGKDSSKSKDEDSEGPARDRAIPPETARDMAVFPLNRAFISQPVLSERLRNEIWFRIMKDGKSVREVSAELGVEMSRVGAVVRLKEVEKEWRQLVSYVFWLIFLSQRELYDDILKNRLVFKTTTWLQNLRMRASLKVLLLHHTLC